MFKRLQAVISPRSIVLSTLAAMMLLSLLYSTEIKYGHADSPIAVSAAEAKPLQAGAPAPYFVVKNVRGDTVPFDPRKLERPAIIITFRGGWCPYCNMHLSELRYVLPEISELGIDVWFLSGDRPEVLYSGLQAETREDIAGLDYQVFSDADAMCWKPPSLVLVKFLYIQSAHSVMCLR